jgi:hypothetical protein
VDVQEGLERAVGAGQGVERVARQHRVLPLRVAHDVAPAFRAGLRVVARQIVGRVRPLAQLAEVGKVRRARVLGDRAGEQRVGLLVLAAQEAEHAALEQAAGRVLLLLRQRGDQDRRAFHVAGVERRHARVQVGARVRRAQQQADQQAPGDAAHQRRISW